MKEKCYNHLEIYIKMYKWAMIRCLELTLKIHQPRNRENEAYMPKSQWLLNLGDGDTGIICVWIFYYNV